MSGDGVQITTSAPGSIMITGEHAVVYGHRAIVAAIAQRVEIRLRGRGDGLVRIQSEIEPSLECSIDALPEGGFYRFVLAALAMRKADWPGGCDLDIRSSIDPTLGLGSSAAITVAALGALSRANRATDLDELHAAALRIVRNLQGRGSGADLAASLFGGCIAYRPPTTNSVYAQISALPRPASQISLRYCGYKTPTAEVLRIIAERHLGQEAKFDDLYARMGRVAEQAISAAKAEDPAFYDALTTYQGLMAELGVSDETLDTIIEQARKEPRVLAAKISGSGLGDCVLAFGPAPDGFNEVKIASEGLVFHD